MFSRKLTFLVVPDSQGISKQLTIRAWYLYAGVLTVLLLLFGCFYLASHVIQTNVVQNDLTRLETENQELTEKYEKLRWNLAEADSRWNDLIQKEVALRTIFDLPQVSDDERQLGIGGPTPPSIASLNEAEMLAYNTEVEVDHLLRLSRFELEKYEEVEESLHDLKDRLDHTPSIWPTKGWYSESFGMREHPFTGYRQMHRGIDVANHKGTPIIAPADGRVRKFSKEGNMGLMLVIDHGYGFVTRYGHLAEVKVTRGQKVKRGDIIAAIGNSGRTTGPHLHYEVWRNSKVLNPTKYILNKM